MRRFIVLGQKARASPDFLLSDIPSTSGRLDVLLHAMRAALLVSHGVRTDTIVYLVLLGEPAQVRTVRVDGSAARYLRPDERSMATTLKKAFCAPCAETGFAPVRPGICVARGAIDAMHADITGSRLYLLDAAGTDVRSCGFDQPAQTFVLGDHLGIGDEQRNGWLAAGARPLSVGPRQLHTQDVIALVANELDRRATVSS